MRTEMWHNVQGRHYSMSALHVMQHLNMTTVNKRTHTYTCKITINSIDKF